MRTKNDIDWSCYLLTPDKSGGQKVEKIMLSLTYKNIFVGMGKVLFKQETVYSKAVHAKDALQKGNTITYGTSSDINSGIKPQLVRNHEMTTFESVGEFEK